MDHFSCFENNVKYYHSSEEPVVSRVRNLEKLITKVFIKVISDSLKPAIEEN